MLGQCDQSLHTRKLPESPGEKKPLRHKVNSAGAQGEKVD